MNCIQNLSYIYLVYVLLILTYWTFTNVNVKVLKVPINTILIIVKKDGWLPAGLLTCCSFLQRQATVRETVSHTNRYRTSPFNCLRCGYTTSVFRKSGKSIPS